MESTRSITKFPTTYDRSSPINAAGLAAYEARRRATSPRLGSDEQRPETARQLLLAGAVDWEKNRVEQYKFFSSWAGSAVGSAMALDRGENKGSDETVEQEEDGSSLVGHYDPEEPFAMIESSSSMAGFTEMQRQETASTCSDSGAAPLTPVEQDEIASFADPNDSTSSSPSLSAMKTKEMRIAEQQHHEVGSSRTFRSKRRRSADLSSATAAPSTHKRGRHDSPSTNALQLDLNMVSLGSPAAAVDDAAHASTSQEGTVRTASSTSRSVSRKRDSSELDRSDSCSSKKRRRTPTPVGAKAPSILALLQQATGRRSVTSSICSSTPTASSSLSQSLLRKLTTAATAADDLFATAHAHHPFQYQRRALSELAFRTSRAKHHLRAYGSICGHSTAGSSVVGDDEEQQSSSDDDDDARAKMDEDEQQQQQQATTAGDTRHLHERQRREIAQHCRAWLRQKSEIERLMAAGAAGERPESRSGEGRRQQSLPPLGAMGGFGRSRSEGDADASARSIHTNTTASGKQQILLSAVARVSQARGLSMEQAAREMLLCCNACRT